MSKDFTGKTVFVTGAASGLGRSTALAFAEEGASLSLMDINREGLLRVQAEIKSLDCPCITHVADVSRKANCDAAIAATVEHFKRLDVLCNVAGVLGFFHSVDITEAEWERVIGTDLNGPFYLSRAAIPHLLQSHGNIVNVSSANGLKAAAYIVPYCTAKAGLLHMTRALAMEYINQPIRINAVLPGTMDTPMVSKATIPEGIDMSLVQRFLNLRPTFDPIEVARFIRYVASDQGKQFHGACLAMDAGLSAG